MAIETGYNFFRVKIESSSSLHVNIRIWALRIEILCNFSHANASVSATQNGILCNFCHVDIVTWGLRSEIDYISVSVFLSVIGCTDWVIAPVRVRDRGREKGNGKENMNQKSQWTSSLNSWSRNQQIRTWIGPSGELMQEAMLVSERF